MVGICHIWCLAVGRCCSSNHFEFCDNLFKHWWDFEWDCVHNYNEKKTESCKLWIQRKGIFQSTYNRNIKQYCLDIAVQTDGWFLSWETASLSGLYKHNFVILDAIYVCPNMKYLFILLKNKKY